MLEAGGTVDTNAALLVGVAAASPEGRIGVARQAGGFGGEPLRFVLLLRDPDWDELANGVPEFMEQLADTLLERLRKASAPGRALASVQAAVAGTHVISALVGSVDGDELHVAGLGHAAVWSVGAQQVHALLSPAVLAIKPGQLATGVIQSALGVGYKMEAIVSLQAQLAGPDAIVLAMRADAPTPPGTEVRGLDALRACWNDWPPLVAMISIG